MMIRTISLANNNLEIGAFIQARMTSQRLPGKVLGDLAGKPLLQYLIERLNRCQFLDRVVVLTSVECSDDPIAEFCHGGGIECFRGDLSNVAKRFLEALEKYRLEAFVRISGDSPLMDPALVDRLIEIFSNNSWQVVTNVQTRTFPSGQSVEIIEANTFRQGFHQMNQPEHFEHVTPWFYKNKDRVKIFNHASKTNFSGVHLSVDTKTDFDLLSRIVAAFDRPHWEYGLTEILDIYQKVTSE